MLQAPQTARPEPPKDPRSVRPGPRSPVPAGNSIVPAPRWKKRLSRILLLLVGVAGLSLSLAFAAALIVVQHYSKGLPSVEMLKAGYEPPQVTRILAADGSVLSSVFKERRTVIPFSEIPDPTKLAFLAAEDAHFYEHDGLNYLGMLRALWADVRSGRFGQGGSTISQQVVRNILLDDRERTLQRKAREMILSRRLEDELTKDEIFSLYLNNVYLGHGRHGIEEAARYYFGKHASELDVGQSAMLAGLVANPTRFSPRRVPAQALRRRQYVLQQMRDKGFVTPAYFDQLYAAPFPVLAPEEDSQSGLAPEAVEVAKDAIAKAEKERPSHGGYAATTTIQPDLQVAARRAVRKALGDYAERHALHPPYESKRVKSWGKPFTGKPSPNRVYVGVVREAEDATSQLDVQVGDVTGHVTLTDEDRFNPKHLPPSQFASVGAVLRVRMLDAADAEGGPRLKLELGPEAALVAIDVRSREVVALVGSEEGFPGGLDRARRARRQPGSAFKPIIYSYALHQRLVTPGTVLNLERPGHGLPEPGHGLPENPPYHLSVRSALAHSNNEAAVELLRSGGPPQIVAWAHELGITADLRPDLSLALGSYEVTPIEMANTFATFASGGFYEPPRLLSELRAPNGELLPLPARDERKRVLSAEEAYLTTSLLESVVRSGTGQLALNIGHPVAGKTGTTNLVKDAWFVGYSTDLSVAVWIGYDDGLPLGPQESGTRTALPAFVDFMTVAHATRPRTEFPRPPGIVTAFIDPETGFLPSPGQNNGVEEEFLDGTVPETVAPPLALQPGPDMAGKMPYKPEPNDIDDLPP